MQLRKNKTGLVYNHILGVEDAQCPIFLPNCPLPLCSRLHNDTSSPRPINQQAASIRRRDPHWSIVSTVPSNVFYLYLLPLLTRCARAGWAGRELVRICMGRDEAWLLLHTEGQGLHSQPSNLRSPTSIYTCISSSSTIRYYPEICRRYSAPPNPSVAIICFRYRSARARHDSAGIYRTLEDKILQVQSSAWAGRWAESAGLMEPDLRQWPHAPSRGWSTLHTLLQVGIIAHCMALSSRQCAKQWHLMCLEKILLEWF